MIERSLVWLATKADPKKEAAAGVGIGALYGSITAFPEEAWKVLVKIPVYGRVVDLFDPQLLRLGAGSVTIAGVVIAADGISRIFKEKKQK